MKPTSSTPHPQVGDSEDAAGGAAACRAHLPILPPQESRQVTTLETTQGLTDSFSSPLPFKYYLPEVASVED